MSANLNPGRENFAIGIDMGGTNTTVGLIDHRGTVHGTAFLKTKAYATPALFADAVAQKVKSLAGGKRLAGIGMGAPNANFHTGEIVEAANLSWPGRAPLAQLLRERTGNGPVFLTNDANAAALGEGLYGGAKSLKDYLVVTLGTGLGSGFVAGGQLILGHDGMAGELGHVIAVRSGRKCGCGRQGCLETYASATGIVRTAEEWLQERRHPSLLHECTGKITAWDIHQAAIKGDAMAKEIFEFTGQILGEALADAVAITSPAAIFFYGGLARSGPLLLAPVREHFEKNVLHLYAGKVVLKESALPPAHAALLGAAALVWGGTTGMEFP